MASVSVQRPARRRRRREDSEQEILEAAARLLRERPFRDLTVDDLMAATSQSRTAFYRHFADRRELLVRLVRDLADQLWAMSEGWLQGSGDPLVVGREAIERLADVYQANGALLVAIAEAAHHDDQLERVYRELVQGFVDATAARIERDVAERRTRVADPAQAAAALVWMTERHLALTFGRRGARPADRDSAVDTLYTIWMRALYGQDPRDAVGHG
jgi:TetR/AcrR family transcriptional regulator, ethionamide resistance regulator